VWKYVCQRLTLQRMAQRHKMMLHYSSLPRTDKLHGISFAEQGEKGEQERIEFCKKNVSLLRRNSGTGWFTHALAFSPHWDFSRGVIKSSSINRHRIYHAAWRHSREENRGRAVHMWRDSGINYSRTIYLKNNTLSRNNSTAGSLFLLPRKIVLLLSGNKNKLYSYT
jgi:hypothetical protein